MQLVTDAVGDRLRPSRDALIPVLDEIVVALVVLVCARTVLFRRDGVAELLADEAVRIRLAPPIRLLCEPSISLYDHP